MTNGQPARVFVGIKIVREVARELADFARPLEGCGARLVPGADIHLTLVPPWNEADMAVATEKLRTAISDFGSFLLTFAHLGYGPTLRHPHLLWVDCVPSKELTGLWIALTAAYGKMDPRPFRPHVTLARIPRNGRVIARANPLDLDLLLTQYVTSVELFQSPSKGQNGYRVVVSLPLRPIPSPVSVDAVGVARD